MMLPLLLPTVYVMVTNTQLYLSASDSPQYCYKKPPAASSSSFFFGGGGGGNNIVCQGHNRRNSDCWATAKPSPSALSAVLGNSQLLFPLLTLRPWQF